MKLILQKKGFAVQTASNGKLGLLSLEKTPVDLVITDIFLDVMDGIETVTAVKKRFPQVKVIAMSGGSKMVDMNSLTVARMLGADRTMTKPTNIPELLALIAELDAEMEGNTPA